MKYENLIYFYSLNNIGGIETWLYNLSVLNKDLDITIVVNRGAKEQIERLKKNVRVIIWNGRDTFECKNLFINFNRSILPYVKADKVHLVLHGDYEDMLKRKQLSMANLPIDDRVDEYIGITKLVCDTWERITGIKATLCYNPVLPKNDKKIIRICSAQRMSKEKGRNRINLLAMSLDRYCAATGNTWIWDIYTDDKNVFLNENIRLIKPRLNVVDYYKGYDWFVALSDNEGYCYSVVENLIRGIPCVVTDLPVFKELGINEDNSLICDMNMTNSFEIVNKMFNEKKVFEYQPPKDNWRFLFGNKKTTYEFKEEKEMLYKVEALNTYTKLRIKDSELNEILPEGFQFEVDDRRLDILLGNNNYKQAFVKKVNDVVVEETKNEEENVAEIVEEKIEEETKRKPRQKKSKK